MRFTTIASVLAASGLVAAAPLEATRDAPVLESAAVTGGAGVGAVVKARDEAVTGAVTGGDTGILLRDAPELESAAVDGAVTGAVTVSAPVKAREDAAREDSDVATGGISIAVLRRDAPREDLEVASADLLKTREDAPELESAATTGGLGITRRADAQREDSDAVTGILTGGVTGVKARDDAPELESAAVSGGIVGAATGGAVKAREDAPELESAAVSGGIVDAATGGAVKAREDAPELESAAVSGVLTGGAVKARQDSCPVTTVGDYVWKITNFIGRKPQGTYFNYIAFDIQSTKQGSSLNFHCQATQTRIPDSKFVRCDGSSSFEFAFSTEYDGLILKYGNAPNANIGTTTVPNYCRAGGNGPDDKVCNGVQDAYVTLLKSPFQYN